MQRTRVLTKQHGEAVEPFVDIPFNDRYQRVGVGEVRLGLGHIERRHEPRVETVLGELERVLLGLDVGVRYPQPLLRRSNIDVREGGLRIERHQYVAVGLYRGLGRGVGGFHLTANATEDIDLPRGTKTRSELIARLEALLGSEVAEDPVFARLRTIGVSGKPHLRFSVARNNSTEGSRFLDPPQRSLQVEVALGRTHDELSKLFVVKDIPPGLEGGLAFLEAFDSRSVPSIGGLGLRLDIVRAYRAATQRKGTDDGGQK